MPRWQLDCWCVLKLGLVCALLAVFILLTPTLLTHRVQSLSVEALIGTSDLRAQIASPQRVKSLKDRAEMVLIPAGPFEYGIRQEDVRRIVTSLRERMTSFYPTELPRQTRTIGPFYIDRYEVTNELYARFLKETNHREPRYWKYPQFNGRGQPVVGVGWADAVAYCGWAGKRLPREEEWEKAARGTDGRIWPWGGEPDDAKYNGRKQANFAPVNVGSFPAGNSAYGVSDMAGNVWEMTSSIWQGQAKAMRGGSFLNTNADVRVTVRWASQDEDRGANWLGFRCVMDVENLERFGQQQ